MSKLSICILLLLIGSFICFSNPVSGEEQTPLVLILTPSAGYDATSLSVLEKMADKYSIPYQLITPDGTFRKDSSHENSIPLGLKDIPESYLNQSEIILIVLGGDGYTDLLNSPESLGLIKKWSDNNHIVGAIGQGPAILSRSGIMQNISATVLPENNLIKILTDGGARYLESPGVITDSVITAESSDQATEFAEYLCNQIIVQKVSSSTGILYLGDISINSSLYSVPGQIHTPKINAIRNGKIVPDWDGSPFMLNTSVETTSVETGVGDWILLYDSAGGVCVLSDPFSGISIPYGTIQMVQNDKLGEKRDFSTISGKVSELFPRTSFREILRSSPELDQSNKSMKDWTDEINITNRTISDSLGDLFDDIGISKPVWDGLSASICIHGREIQNGVIDIRSSRDDPSSSVLYSKGAITKDLCTHVLLQESYNSGTSVYVVLTDDEDLVIADLQITLP